MLINKNNFHDYIIQNNKLLQHVKQYNKMWQICHIFNCWTFGVENVLGKIGKIREKNSIMKMRFIKIQKERNCHLVSKTEKKSNTAGFAVIFVQMMFISLIRPISRDNLKDMVEKKQWGTKKRLK